MENYEDRVAELLKKAANAERADDAMKFAQAALNAANAIIGLRCNPEK